MDKQAEDDNHLWNKWRTTQKPEYFQSLYMSMKPDITKAMKNSTFRSNLPESAHRIWAAQAFHDALNTYKPDKGASLRTHIFGAVQNKSKRLDYQFGNLGYKPEPRASQVGLYQNEYESFRAEHGREPSSAEMADRLGWALKDVATLQREIMKDLAMAEGTEEKLTFEGRVEEEALDLLYPDLNAQQQLVFDYFFGRHGKPKMVKPNGRVDFEGISARVGFSSSKVRSLGREIGQLYEKAVKR